MMGKVALIIAAIVIFAVAVIAIIKLWDVVHQSMADRQLKKLNDKLDEIEERGF